MLLLAGCADADEAERALGIQGGQGGTLRKEHRKLQQQSLSPIAFHGETQ